MKKEIWRWVESKVKEVLRSLLFETNSMWRR